MNNNINNSDIVKALSQKGEFIPDYTRLLVQTKPNFKDINWAIKHTKNG